MKRLIVIFALVVPACNAPHGPDREFRAAQGLVNRIAREYPEIVQLSLHATPTGQSRCRIIACNRWEKVGEASYRQEIEAMQTRTASVLRAGRNVEVTAPVLDKSGNAIAAVGIMLQLDDGMSEEALVNHAKAIAREMSRDIQDAGQAMW